MYGQRDEISDNNYINTRLVNGPKDIVSRYIYYYTMINGFVYPSILHTWFNFYNLQFRSYVIKRTWGSDILNNRTDHAYYHFAIIKDKLSSCVTFISPSDVPPGEKYNVSTNITIEFILRLYYACFSAGNVFESLWCKHGPSILKSICLQSSSGNKLI